MEKYSQISQKTCPAETFDRNTQVMYPVVSEYEAITRKSGEPESTSLSQRYQIQKYLAQGYVSLSMIGRPNFFMSKPLVRAAGFLKRNSATEIIHVNTLSEGNTSVIQHVCNVKNSCTSFILFYFEELNFCLENFRFNKIFLHSTFCGKMIQ